MIAAYIEIPRRAPRGAHEPYRTVKAKWPRGERLEPWGSAFF
jgi:hypothetical protein